MCRYFGVIIGFLIFLTGCSPAMQDDMDSNVATILAGEQSLVIETTLQAVPDSLLTPIKEVLEVENSPEPPASMGPGLEPLVTMAVDDLAKRLGITIDEITLVSAEAVVWPDDRLGCPQPDLLYQQVQEDGVLIILRVGEREYAYHSGGGHDPFLCEQQEPVKHPQIKSTKGIYHPP